MIIDLKERLNKFREVKKGSGGEIIFVMEGNNLD
jgi:hypothetical protein